MIERESANQFKSLIPLIVLAITTLVGQMIYLGFASLYHFVIIGLFALVLIKKRYINIRNTTAIMKFFLLWVFEAICSVVWAPSKELAMQYVYYIFLMMAMCFLFHHYINKESIEGFAVVMVAILFLCNVIAIWEVVTGNHLVKDYLSTPLRQRLFQYVPGTFYRNPNDFATFVIQAIPFSLYLAMSHKKIIRMVAIFNVVASFFSVIAAQSRTQIILLILIYVCSAIFMDKKKLLGISVLLLLGVVVIYNIYPAFEELVDEGLMSISVGEIASSTEDGGSLGTRIALLKNAGRILLDTMGFGAGAGCHRVIMSEYAARYNYTGGILVMHNLLGEIFVDYGIIIGIAFIITLVISIKKLFIIGRYVQEKQIRQFSFFLSLSLGVFVICGMSSSSILQLTSLWMTICFASAFIKVYTIDEWM